MNGLTTFVEYLKLAILIYYNLKMESVFVFNLFKKVSKAATPQLFVNNKWTIWLQIRLFFIFLRFVLAIRLSCHKKWKMKEKVVFPLSESVGPPGLPRGIAPTKVTALSSAGFSETRRLRDEKETIQTRLEAGSK